ncbi:MAG: shikimate dehydrogenase [Methanobrevibacter sp.]|uniref:shikimate dehydrogenase n=1 Tax=Methanobrevibacter sp. TaxID=66852 RepID=UPI0026E01957|nr:shikimate dehydrogenase [Methanobrevibacter sp.]MDO5847966.1 shikimate dehydrogenase [Methanobrevibacter sp.]
MTIKGSTSVVGLIGNPVEHSFSPPMHNAAFKALGMDYVYVAFDVLPENVGNAIKGAESLNIKGFNVTIPHKIEVMKHLNEIDDVARLIGAVNTIDFKNLKGYNTDGIGAIKAINEATDIKDKKVVLAGAGGAARAIAFYLAKENPEEIVILNRNTEKSDNLAHDVAKSKLTDNVTSDSINAIEKYLRDADILVDSTPLGMYPHVDDAPIATADMMHEDLVVNDIVYNPNETVLLKEAIKAGATPVYGIKMLLYQGAESFKIWTGQEPPIDVMEKALKETLNIAD